MSLGQIYSKFHATLKLSSDVYNSCGGTGRKKMFATKTHEKDSFSLHWNPERICPNSDTNHNITQMNQQSCH